MLYLTYSEVVYARPRYFAKGSAVGIQEPCGDFRADARDLAGKIVYAAITYLVVAGGISVVRGREESRGKYVAYHVLTPTGRSIAVPPSLEAAAFRLIYRAGGLTCSGLAESLLFVQHRNPYRTILRLVESAMRRKGLGAGVGPHGFFVPDCDAIESLIDEEDIFRVRDSMLALNSRAPALWYEVIQAIDRMRLE